MFLEIKILRSDVPLVSVRQTIEEIFWEFLA